MNSIQSRSAFIRFSKRVHFLFFCSFVRRSKIDHYFDGFFCGIHEVSFEVVKLRTIAYIMFN